ncbi:transposase [Marinitoga sp. 1154]|uniref:transposase n=1 Tax=Marinitoga sp. 1154 TaxID=1643335 RepID=UPI0015861BD4
MWKNNWELAYFKYSEPIRKLICTTNPIENIHRQFRKITKNKSVFPTDESLIKAIYLAAIRVTAKVISLLFKFHKVYKTFENLRKNFIFTNIL